MPQVNRQSEFVMLDFPRGVRFTHYPSGDTCLRHEWMTGRQSADWVAKLRDFLARHPTATTVCSGKWEVIDNLDDHPLSGGTFAVGDLVVTRKEGFGEPDCVREIVGVRDQEIRDEYTDADSVTRSFVLEDGQVMYWSTGNEGWMVDARNSDRDGRARRPLKTEDIEPLRYPAEEMLRKACADAGKPMAELAVSWALGGERFACQDAAETFRSEVAGTALELVAHEAGLAAYVKARDRAWGRDKPEAPDLAPVTETLSKAAALARSAMDLPEARDAGLHSMGANLDTVVLVGTTVTETLRRRAAAAPDAEAALPSP